ncbi:MAG: tetratricopeptide repeat protein, partial [Candidatus Hodarchaeota archaeon]
GAHIAKFVKEIELEDLLLEGKIEETQRIVNEFDEKELLTEQDKLIWQIFIGNLNYHKGEFNKANEIGLQAYQKSLTMGNLRLIIMSISLRFNALLFLGSTFELEDDKEKAEKILESALDEPRTVIEEGETILRSIKGWFFWSRGEYDIALENVRRSLEYCENQKWALYVFSLQNLIGHIYEQKGDLELALSSHKKSLEFSNGNSFVINLLKGSSYNELGAIYYQQGNLDQAIESYKKGLEIFEQYDEPLFYIHMEICWIYNDLIRIFLDKKSSTLTNEFLHRFHKFTENTKNLWFIDWYKLSEARILKSSLRIRDKAKAEEIFRKLIDTYKELDFRLFTQAILENCDFYLAELN